MRKTVLFYIDPVPSHGDTLFYKNKIDLVTRLAEAYRETTNVCVITSPQLARIAGSSISYVYHLPINLCLSGYDYSVVSYYRGICKESINKAGMNEAIVDEFTHADNIISPDYVISFTENYYLRRVFSARCFFSEVSPLPRWFTEPSLLFDPFGFQFDGGLKRYVDRGIHHPFDETFEAAFDKFWCSPVNSWSESMGMAEWVRSFRKDNKILVLALQPAKDINYVGSGVDGDEVALIRRVAQEFPSDYKILVFLHPASEPLEASLVEEILESYPNVAFPPPHLRKGRTEAALVHADAVAAVSSNMLFLGAVLGLEVYSYGMSRFECLSRFNSKVEERRLDLLAFVVERYAVRESAIMQPHYDLTGRLATLDLDMFSYGEDERRATGASLSGFLPLSRENN